MNGKYLYHKPGFIFLLTIPSNPVNHGSIIAIYKTIILLARIKLKLVGIAFFGSIIDEQ
jgi:hypothetical protein